MVINDLIKKHYSHVYRYGIRKLGFSHCFAYSRIKKLNEMSIVKNKRVKMRAVYLFRRHEWHLITHANYASNQFLWWDVLRTYLLRL